jgi:Cof subfamily protein (haloacid dehalogenase superfamily)
MNTRETSPNLRLAAFDLDGTLLGPDSTISRENRAALARLADAGFEIVLASGRHYHSVASYAAQLPEVKWIVSSQGAEVGTTDRSHVLGRTFLREAEVKALMDAENGRGFTPVYYTGDDVFTATRQNDALAGYIALSGYSPVLADRAEIGRMELQKILWLGERERIADLRTDESVAALGVQSLQTQPDIFEFMPIETTKAHALQKLTDHLGLTPENVVVFGDGENDISMFRWAGHSYAMPHGWAHALAAAKRIAPEGPPETSVAKAVEEMLA